MIIEKYRVRLPGSKNSLDAAQMIYEQISEFSDESHLEEFISNWTI